MRPIIGMLAFSIGATVGLVVGFWTGYEYWEKQLHEQIIVSNEPKN